MAYAQFGYPSYPTTSQMLTVSTGGPITGTSSAVSSSCGSSGISSPSPQSPPCSEATIPSGPNTACNRASPSPSPPISSASSVVQQAAAYESRLLSTAAYHHPSIHSVHHSHQVHPRLTAAGFYGAAGGSSLHASGSGSATISYATDSSVTSNGYASLATVDSSAFYPTLSSGFGMKDDPWRGTLSSTAHPANPHQTTASYYYDPTLAAYGYGGLDFNGARRKNVTRDSTTTLKAWLGEHRKNPYPTKGEKIMLAIITKMTLTQVSTWFANARRRLKKENKMTWEPRNKVETEDHGDDSQTDSGSRRSDEDDRKTKETILPAKQERLDKEEPKCSDIHMTTEIVPTKRNDDFDDRNRLACLGRTHSLDANDTGLYRGRSTVIGNEPQNGTRLSTLSLHSSYPGSVINEFPGSCLQLPFSPVPSVPSGSSAPFRPHHSPSLMGPDSLIAPPVSQYGNRYQVSPEQANILTGTSAFTPSTTSSSEGDSQDLLSCNALDAFIKDASLSSSSSGDTSSPMGNVDVDNAYSPVIAKPKIWSLAATATSKSPPPPLGPNVQIPSCAKYGDYLPNQSYQKHCVNSRDSFNYPSCNSDSWYAYPTRQQPNPQFHQGPSANGHSSFGHRSCYSPSPPQTDTPPQTPPSLKVVGHQLNNYGGGGAPNDHHLYGNYTQHHMGGGGGGGKSSLNEGVKSVRGSMICEVQQPHSTPGENTMEKRNGLVSMENALDNGASLEVVGGNGSEYQRLSLSEDESSSPCSSANGHRSDAVHGVTPLTAYRNCFAGEPEFEIP